MRRALLAALTAATWVASGPAPCFSEAASDPAFRERAAIFDYDASAPLDVREAAVFAREGAVIRDVSYASPKGGRVTAYLVTPPGKGPFAGVVFLHWGQGNRSSFLPEAMALARAGAESLLIDAPFIRPAPWRVPDGDYSHPEIDRDTFIRTVVELRRGIDLLVSRPEIDPRRIGYVGHSFGATWGGVLAGVETRIRAVVLMAGLPRVGSDLSPGLHPILAEYIASVPPETLRRYAEGVGSLDAVNYVGHATAPILLQFARFDLYISEKQAAEYAQAAGPGALTKWYDTGHELNAPEALADRDRWLSDRLGLGEGAVTEKAPQEAAAPPVPPAQFFRKEVLYTVPGMDSVTIRKDIEYALAGKDPLRMDLYQPASVGSGGRSPAVILVHGDAPDEVVGTAKDWGFFTSYGRIIAASGMAAITFNHRSSAGGPKLHEAARDVDALVTYVRGHAADLGIDPDRIGVWVFSAGGPYGLRAAMDGPPPFVRAIVAYYTPMDLRPMRARIPRRVLDDTLREFSPIESLKIFASKMPPILIAKAGLDDPAINDSIDAFVAEARARGVGVELLDHPSGHHAFDLLDDAPRTREIVAATLVFLRRNLGAD